MCVCELPVTTPFSHQTARCLSSHFKSSIHHQVLFYFTFDFFRFFWFSFNDTQWDRVNTSALRRTVNLWRRLCGHRLYLVTNRVIFNSFLNELTRESTRHPSGKLVTPLQPTKSRQRSQIIKRKSQKKKKKLKRKKIYVEATLSVSKVSPRRYR